MGFSIIYIVFDVKTSIKPKRKLYKSLLKLKVYEPRLRPYSEKRDKRPRCY
jgi:hypothetical protein